MASVSGIMNSGPKQLVGSLSKASNDIHAARLDAGNNPEHLKNYNNLINKPIINGVELRGDIDTDTLNILRPLTDTEIDQIMVVPEEV